MSQIPSDPANRLSTSGLNSDSPGEPVPTDWLDRFMTATIVIVTILVSALAMSPSVADPDIWGHIQFGREVIETGEIAPTTSFSFTAEGYRWINHENLSEIVMAWTYDHLGTTGLLYGKFLLSLFVIGSILWFNLRRKTGLIPSCILTIFVAWNLGYHWSFRPQLSSFFFFTVMILLLHAGFKDWQGSWHLKWMPHRLFNRGKEAKPIGMSTFQIVLLWLVPVVILLWTNSHGGFVAGVCVFCCYLGCRLIELVSSNGIRDRNSMLRLGMLIAVAMLTVMVNPYSYRLPLWLVESLGVSRPEILDWSSGQLYSMIGAKFWGLILLVLFALTVSRRSLDFTHLVLLAITMWQAISHFRHVPFFAILAAFWVGPHLNSAMARVSAALRGSTPETAAPMRIRSAIASILVAVTLLIGFRLNDRLSQLRVDREVFPVEAFQYMSDQRLGGRMVVTYDWAQYAIAAACVEQNLSDGQPASRLAFDGRFRTCYPQQVVDMHFDFLFGVGPGIERYRSPDSPECDPQRVLRHGNPDLVLIRRIGERTVKVMEQSTDEWALLYQDALAQIWGRKTRYDNPNSPDFVPELDRIISNTVHRGYADWPALPKTNRVAPANAVASGS